MRPVSATHFSSSFAVIVCTVIGFVSAVQADDIVIFRTGKDEQVRSRWVGEVLDETEAGVRIRLASGREETVALERVLSVTAEWQPEHVAADAAFDKRQFANALEKYLLAGKREHRPWVARRIQAQIILCQRGLGQIHQALVGFHSVLKANSQSPHFSVIPLSWLPREPDGALKQSALECLKREDSVSKLTGASWLVSLGEQGTAVEALQRLTTHRDPRVALLAEAQLWRTRVVTATADDAARWQSQLAKFPEELRAGPTLIVAQTFSHLGEHEAAAMLFMRVAILSPRQVDLTGPALLAAGRALERLQRYPEAVSLFREVVSTFADAPSITQEAEARITALSKKP